MAVRFSLVTGKDGLSASRGKNILILVGLVLLTTGAVLLGAWTLFSPSSGKRDDPRTSQVLYFKCGDPKCGHEFQMTVLEYATWAAKTRPGGKNAERAECPKCGGKFTGVPMPACRKCGRHFPDEQVKKVEKPDGQERYCPYCNELLGKKRVRQFGEETPDKQERQTP